MLMSIAIPLLTSVTLNPTTSSIIVSWIAPQFTSDSYSVTVSCSPLCDNLPTLSSVLVSNGGATNHTITALDPGSVCTVKVIAVFGNTSSESDQVNTTTLTDGMYSATVALFIFTSCLSSPCWCSWNTH